MAAGPLVECDDLAELAQHLVARRVIGGDGGERLQRPGLHAQVAGVAAQLQRVLRGGLRAVAITGEPQHLAQLAVHACHAGEIADALLEGHGALILLARFLAAVQVTEQLRQLTPRVGLAARIVDGAIGLDRGIEVRPGLVVGPEQHPCGGERLPGHRR